MKFSKQTTIRKLFSRLYTTLPKIGRCLDKTNIPGGYVYVVGPGNQWNPKSVVVHIAGKKFMFNCGPGTSRSLREHKGIARDLQTVFLTRPTWENFGGFRGLVLGFEESISEKIVIHGFPCKTQLLPAGKPLPKKTPTKVVKGEGCYIGKNIQINHVTLNPSTHENLNTLPHKEPHQRNWYSHSKGVLAYVLNYSKSQSTLDYTKIVEKRVPAGRYLIDLLAGKDITLPNGNIVRAEDVLTSPLSNKIIVIECPSEDYLTSVEDSNIFQECQNASKLCATVIVHFTPSAVMQCLRYIKWMKKFSPSTIHLIVNDSNLVDGLLTFRYRQRILNELHPGIFPVIKDQSYYWLPAGERKGIYGKTRLLTDNKNLNIIGNAQSDLTPTKGSEEWLNQWKKIKDLNIYEGRPGTRIVLRPCTLSRNAELIFEESTYSTTLRSTLPTKILNEVHQNLENAGVEIRNPARLSFESEQTYPRVVFLGTGLRAGTKLRNLPSILLRLETESSILLECGEGTHAQIHRFYGDEAPKIFRSINAFYISHPNGEHEIGLLDILRERRNAFGSDKVKPLLLLASSKIQSWLNKMKIFYDATSQLIFVPLTDLLATTRSSGSSLNAMNYIYSKTGFVKIQTAKSRAPAESFGVSFVHADDWKLVYSGDPPFNKDLIGIGERCDLLISGGTYKRSIENLPLEPSYSMVRQLLKTARNMKAKFTIVTNFSQRFSTVPHEEMLKHNDLSFALDFMQVSLQSCHHLPLLHEMFRYFDEYSEGETTKTQRTAC